MTGQSNTHDESSDSKVDGSDGETTPSESGRIRNRRLPNVGSRERPEPENLDGFFKEFVVLAKPIAVFSRPDGSMGIINRFEDVMAHTMYACIHPDRAPLTYRVVDEVERFARLTIVDDEPRVVLGTHLEGHNVLKDRAPKKKHGAAVSATPLEDMDAANVIFLWLNRDKLPSWADLEHVE